MEISTTSVSGTTVIAISGSVDVNKADELKKRLLDVIRAGQTRIVLNLDAIHYVDYTGISILILAASLLRDKGQRLRLVNLSPSVRAVFEITNSLTIFDVFKTVEDSVAFDP